MEKGEKLSPKMAVDIEGIAAPMVSDEPRTRPVTASGDEKTSSKVGKHCICTTSSVCDVSLILVR